MTNKQKQEILDFGRVRTTRTIMGSREELGAYINDKKVNVDFRKYRRLWSALNYIRIAQFYINQDKDADINIGYYNEYELAKNWLKELKIR